MLEQRRAGRHRGLQARASSGRWQRQVAARQRCSCSPQRASLQALLSPLNADAGRQRLEALPSFGQRPSDLGALVDAQRCWEHRKI